MAFDYPPSILGGISHPDVIQNPGNGAALAGGLQNVLAALLQHAQNAQNAQAFQADLAQKAAQTEEARQHGIYYGAEAQRAGQPVAREGHVQVQPDGSVVLIDPITGKVTPTAAKGVPAQRNIDPNSPEGIAARVKEYQATTAAAQRQQAAREEMKARQERINQGKAILGSVAKGGPQDPVLDAFGQSFRAVRQGNPKMHPGEAAYYAWDQLAKTRPDLIPPKPRVPNALDDLLGGASGSPAEAGRQPLTDVEKQTARTDPGFAAWLKTSKGYTEQDWQK